ncbi:phage baseplate assembly protein V [Burkholderia gladioli]|uniref:phage baseplate assembly protein V n=1 Tax=Burkholderia gladioli TaxID=28095 RepID=UPI0016416AD8|nr:phage baseplate assembly protein V [Burkholderia gladioli]
MDGSRANEAARVVRNSALRGTVIDVDASDAANPVCRVAVGDPDIDGQGLESGWIRWCATRAGATRTWSAPSIGEQVTLVCPMGDLAQALVVGALYDEDHPAPATGTNQHIIQFQDGARLAYDDAAHALSVTLPAGGTIVMRAPATVQIQTQQASVTAQAITLDAALTTCKGALTVEGPLTFLAGMDGQGGNGGRAVMRINGSADFTGDVTASGKSLAHHRHRAQGESADTTEPL